MNNLNEFICDQAQITVQLCMGTVIIDFPDNCYLDNRNSQFTRHLLSFINTCVDPYIAMMNIYQNASVHCLMDRPTPIQVNSP